MIHIEKIKEPQSLIDHKADWTTELMQYIKNRTAIPDNLKNKYKQDDVKIALLNEAHGKCMYCESPIGAVAYEHIEHIKPKSKYPALFFEWSNLGLACPKCNMNKSDNYDEDCSIVNPYQEDSDDYFISAGTMIFHKAGNKRAELTEFLLQLNRPDLMEARKNQIDKIRGLVDEYLSEKNKTLKALLYREIQKEIDIDKPYSMCTKAVVNQLIH